MIRTANPALNDKMFGNFDLTSAAPRDVMTLAGTVNKTTILLVLVMLAAAFTWYLAVDAGPDVNAMSQAAFPWMIGGAIVGFIIALVTIFAPKASPFTAPAYAVAEGAFLGGLSCEISRYRP